jgi:hypothetical protein
MYVLVVACIALQLLHDCSQRVANIDKELLATHEEELAREVIHKARTYIVNQGALCLEVAIY